MHFPHNTFHTLYPDVDPATPIPASTPERMGMTLAIGILAFGGASGDLVVTFAGLALILLAVGGASRKTARRIRQEARDRFPHLPWAENHSQDTRGFKWALPLSGLTILTICLLTLWLIPADFTLTGATMAALVSMVATWFTPGFSPRQHAAQPSQAEAPIADEAQPQELTTGI